MAGSSGQVDRVRLKSIHPVGVFGGTFDPVHFGHLRTAQAAMALLDLPELRLIPAFQSPHREPPVASPAQRLAMLALAIQGLPGFRVDDQELRRGGLSYTVTTLEALRRELGDQVTLYLLIGMDQFLAFERWHRWREIPGLSHLAVLNRPGSRLPPLPAWAAGRLASRPNELAKDPAGRLVFLTVQPQDISATGIRKRLAQGNSVTGLLPDPVIEYIRHNRLYDGPGPEV